MRSFLSYAKANKEAIIGAIGQLVECESPSDSPRDVNRFVDLLIEQTRDIAAAKLFKSSDFGRHLRLDFKLGGRGREGQILALGHSDTVWPTGTLQTMPFRRFGGRLWGPGVLDMKAGLALFTFAVRALRDLDIPIRRRVALLIVSDEETGSTDSRGLTETEARRSDCVLVLEPGTGVAGKLKTARKGIAGYSLSVQGQAAHAGVDFTKGASAIVEMARQIDRLATFTDLERGITVNPGVVSGGTRSNVVAANAHVEIDVRFEGMKDAQRIDRKMRGLRPVDERCKLVVEGGVNRPAMVRTKAIGELFQLARQVAAELGVALEESSTGGGSDGNFTAALGIPTLDGLGAVGEGAHAQNESILIDRIADRTALLAGLLSRL